MMGRELVACERSLGTQTSREKLPPTVTRRHPVHGPAWPSVFGACHFDPSNDETGPSHRTRTRERYYEGNDAGFSLHRALFRAWPTYPRPWFCPIGGASPKCSRLNA